MVSSSRNKLETYLKVSLKNYSLPIEEQCSFRRYPLRRYYGLNDEHILQFLVDTPYIRGMKPNILRSNFSSQKICINSSDWEEFHQGTLKYSDGQNPSLINLSNTSKLFHSIEMLHPLKSYYVASVTFGDSQCKWKESLQESRNFKLSLYEKPPSIRSILLLLTEKFKIIKQTTIILLQDTSKWGKKNLKPVKRDRSIQQLGDAKLFYYKNNVYVSFRNGRHFGYTTQVLNRLYFDSNLSIFFIKASESIALDGGRNFAMFESHEQKLMTLTWVDPLTVVPVDTNVTFKKRIKVKKKKRSNIHGTNGMLVPFQDELLGIAHFHRPGDRKTSDYARHGHHYTHAFYTISSKPPYKLRRLSNEFIFPSAYKENDGDLIQFAAGLVIKHTEMIISYGINDCEGAIMKLAIENLKRMLIKVDYDGQEVVDLMKHVETKA